MPARLESQADEAWIHAALLFHTCPELYNGPAALDLARAVVAVNPRRWEYQFPLGMALYRRGHFEKALAALGQASKTFPNFEDIDTEAANEPLRLFPLAMTQWQLGRRDEARATYDRAAAEMDEISPRFPVFVLLRDEAARTLGVDQPR